MESVIHYIPLHCGKCDLVYGSSHETAAVLLPGFAINW